MKKLEEQFTWEELAERIASKIEDEKFIETKLWNRDKFKVWFMKREKVGLRFDWRLVARAYTISKELQSESDHFTLVVGKEGSGKTTFLVQFCAFISPSMALDDILYNIKQYIKKLKHIAQNYKKDNKDEDDLSILMDEGGINLYSKDSMSKSNKMLGKTFMVQRFLNLHIGICIPFYWAIDKIIRTHRVNTLVVIKERGKYKTITGKGIKIFNKLFSKDQDRETWNVPIPYDYFWEGHFQKGFPNTINKDDYETHKLKYIREFLDDMDKEVDSTEKNPEDVKMVKISKVAKGLGLSSETIKRMIKNKEVDGKMIRKCYYITNEAFNKLKSTRDV